MAGYVLDTNHRRWIVVMMVNHANPGIVNATQAAQDALLAWVQAR